MQLNDEIDRRAGIAREQFEQDYLMPLRPVVLTGTIDHWSALGRWTPAFSERTTATSRSRSMAR